MRDCYYVFIPGGARKSSSIQLARRSQAAVLGSRYVPTAVERRRRGCAALWAPLHISNGTSFMRTEGKKADRGELQCLDHEVNDTCSKTKAIS